MAEHSAMTAFRFQEGEIEGLWLIHPLFAEDSRGYFSKTFERSLFTRYGISMEPVEELESKSAQHTLRGLHFQHQNRQDKLVRVLSGEIYGVAVDIRPEPASFGRWQSFRLSAENRQMVLFPKPDPEAWCGLRNSLPTCPQGLVEAGAMYPRVDFGCCGGSPAGLSHV